MAYFTSLPKASSDDPDWGSAGSGGGVKEHENDKVFPPVLTMSTSKLGLDFISGASSDPSSGSAESTVWLTFILTTILEV